ncbi:MAG: hypothetical protein IAF58_01595 [Leptolyngbya sp.]|nr:hypothetical protein [Candidatus Melainabacteria bacterium]
MTENLNKAESSLSELPKEPMPTGMQSVTSGYRLAVYLFIITYFSIAVISLLPAFAYQIRLANGIAWLSHPFNLVQNWKLFCPDVRSINFYSQAVIQFQDGTLKYYEYPRLNQMPMFESYRRQKLCKIFQDCMPWPDFALFWPDAARQIARANLDPLNQPVMISFSYNWAKVPDAAHYAKQNELPEPRDNHTFFVYQVKPEDLK